jgi:hypothetical protein
VKMQRTYLFIKHSWNSPGVDDCDFAGHGYFFS